MISAWPQWIQLIWFNWFSGEKNKSLKIFGIFCFKDLTFYGGDIAGRNPAVGLIRSEAPWSSANSLAAADLVMEWDDRMTLDDIQWKMEIMEIMEITELETWHPPSQIQVDCGHLRKSSLHPINPCTKTIFGEGTNAVAGEYLGSIRSCQRRQKFSCKQSRGYTAGFAGYRGDMERTYSEKIIWQKFKIEIKKSRFFGEWRQSLSCSNPSFGHPQLQIRWSGTGISTRFALLVSIHANLEHFQRVPMIHNNSEIQKLKNTKKLTICTYFALYCSNLHSVERKYIPMEGLSSPSVPHPVPFDPWKAGSPKFPWPFSA